MARKDYVVGSGNVFKDLGHARPAEALAKAELARKIAELITKRRLTQAAAAELLNVDQPKVSALVRGRLAGFSLDRLVRFLVQLGSDVEIVVKPRSRADKASARHGRLNSSEITQTRTSWPAELLDFRFLDGRLLSSVPSDYRRQFVSDRENRDRMLRLSIRPLTCAADALDWR